MKIVIIGNSGSGKTWMANQLAEQATIPVVHLDELFWEPGGFNKKREPDEVLRLIIASKKSDSWIVEGVFGELAKQFLNETEILIWLDLEWFVCGERLKRRGSVRKTHMSRKQSHISLNELIEWAACYSTRTGSCSFDGHLKLFNQFEGVRYHLTSEKAMNEFLKDTLLGVNL